MPKHKKILIIAAFILVVSLGLLAYFFIQEIQKYEFRVSFLDVGQGDATLIQFNNGEQMLVDCGKDRKILSRLGQTLPFYDRSIDYLLVTHPDLDHYGGCIDVLRNYTIKQIVLNGHRKQDLFYEKFEHAIKDEGAIIKIIHTPEVWKIASSTLEFLSPDQTLMMGVGADDSNNYSIVFRLTNATSSFLFTADMEMPLENALLNKYCISTSTFSCPALEAYTLKVGHHGSDTSSGENFLKAVKAEEGIISVGKNTYGHPSLRVLHKLERAKVKMFRTDQAGDIVRF
jgi:competence protein ComEC